MATFKEIVYLVLDEIKSVNSDSYITEEHVIFLANLYRELLLKQKIAKEGVLSISSKEELTICLDLEYDNRYGDCGDVLLKSVQDIPNTLNGSPISLYINDFFNTMIVYISPERMRYVGYNKYLLNIVYCCIHDNKAYLKSANPQFSYLVDSKVKIKGVFEDAAKAAELSCSSSDSEEELCTDIMEMEFPLSGDLIPLLILVLVLELYQALSRPADNVNNNTDDFSDIITYVRRNMKSNIAKQLE